MEEIILTGVDPGKVVFAYPLNKSLSDWITYRVQFTEGSGSDAGKYIANIDPLISDEWVVFFNTDQPGSWSEVLNGVYYNLDSSGSTEIIENIISHPVLGSGPSGLITNANISASEVVKIHRAVEPLDPGGEATRNRIWISEKVLIERITKE